MFPLGLLALGDRLEVVEVIPGKHSGAAMENLGFREGYTVKMLKNEGRGPLLLKMTNPALPLNAEWP